MRWFKILLLSFVSPALGIAQIQSFEFGGSLTNALVVPSGKVIRIHSLISSSFSFFYEQSGQWGRDAAAQGLSQAPRGIIIRLDSGSEINLSAFTVSAAGAPYSFGAAVLSSINSATPNSPFFIPGPLTILKNGNATVLLIYEVLDNLGTSSLTQAPTQGSSVVIPTSAVGDVDVKIEQSADNVTWTECLPGTYNSSTVKRFFRLRAVEK